MEITGSHRIPASRDAVWAGLDDLAVMRASIPGCERYEVTSATERKGAVATKVGPIKAVFDGALTVTEAVEPERCTVAFEGFAGPSGSLNGAADVTLTEDGDETVFDYTVHAEVGGKIGQLGSRLLNGVAQQTAEAFFANFTRELASGNIVGRPPLADAPPMVHEEPAEGAPALIDAPPLADVPQPAPQRDLPATATPADDEPAEVTEAKKNDVSRILFVAAVAIVAGFFAYQAFFAIPR